MQNNFGLADAAALSRGFPRRNGNVEPIDVFYTAALVANKMMMPVKVGVERAAFPSPGAWRTRPVRDKSRKTL